ncbi:MAG: outer membrane protein assembly factor BamD [Bacteroidales bacterium]|nr:outer membrane protein assembly factor BamD [Bacteroidales bacterium]
MRKIVSIVVVMVTAAVALASCSSKFEKLLSGYNYGEKYRAALQYYEEGKYSKAAQLFENIAVNAQGAPQEDTVRFYWGMSNYNMKDYITAQSNFNEFMLSFPSSPFAKDAEFYMIDCMYRQTYRWELDQRPTELALAYINKYIIENPKSDKAKFCRIMRDDLEERLDRKAYEAAKLYYHTEYYLSAHYALKNVLKEDADNQYREEILYYTAMAAYKYALNSVEEKQRERYMTFVDDYFNFVSEYPQSKYKAELDGIYKKVNKIIRKEN